MAINAVMNCFLELSKEQDLMVVSKGYTCDLRPVQCWHVGNSPRNQVMVRRMQGGQLFCEECNKIHCAHIATVLHALEREARVMADMQYRATIEAINGGMIIMGKDAYKGTSDNTYQPASEFKPADTTKGAPDVGKLQDLQSAHQARSEGRTGDYHKQMENIDRYSGKKD